MENEPIMFSIKEKRLISNLVQEILKLTKHPELPKEGEVQFRLQVKGAEVWSWADVYNNEAVNNPIANPWNEKQDCDNDRKD